MSGHDEELERLRAAVNCATVLERLVPGWTLDKAESTRNALKYRRGPGEIVIVNHQGRGWWDPQSDARGDVFNLAQHLDPSLNFGHVRRALRGLAGVAPGLSRIRAAAPRRRPGTAAVAPLAGSAPVAERVSGLALPDRRAPATVQCAGCRR